MLTSQVATLERTASIKATTFPASAGLDLWVIFFSVKVRRLRNKIYKQDKIRYRTQICRYMTNSSKALFAKKRQIRRQGWLMGLLITISQRLSRLHVFVRNLASSQAHFQHVELATISVSQCNVSNLTSATTTPHSPLYFEQVYSRP